jgi:RNA polymerase sigma-70 factor (ECF subfamily)
MQEPTPLARHRIAILWEELSTPLRSFIRSRVSDEFSADDILHDVFLRMHTHIDTLKDENRLRSWMYQIARNAIIDYYRSRQSTTTLAGKHNEVADDGNEEDVTVTLASSLRQMIDELPDPYRRAVILAELEGLTQRELSEKEGISLSGAKSRVQRGRGLLKDMLLNCCHFDFDRRGAVIDYYDHCCCCEEQRSKKS